MVRWLGILLGTLRSTVHTHRELALENLALRQQLAVRKARQPRPRLTAMDRIFWVVLSRLWNGELLKLGLTVSQATVSKYMLRPRQPPSQAWRTFLKNHAKDLIALDFFTVPTATFRVLFVLVVLSHDRRRLVHFAGAFQCHGTSDRGLDWTATDRGVRAGGGPTPSDP